MRWSLIISRPRLINGIQCWDGIEIDITERKEIELELRKTKERAEENDRLKTAFLQNISHEIRTPMNAIVGFANMLSDDSTTWEERENFIPIIQSSSKQLLSIVTDVLSISSIMTRQEKLRVEHVIIPDLLKELLVSFTEANEKEEISIELDTEGLDTDLMVSTDRTKLTQILSNLLQNALKFTEEGLVEFGCRRDRNDDSDFLVFYVKDSGVGIQKEDLDKIFDRFVRGTHERGKSFAGTGLGLSICKGYTELLGGEIWVESELGSGSVFSFSIPYKLEDLVDPDNASF